MVSVIVTAYNSARWLPESIESVLTQSYRHLELIVVDDRSSDGSQALVEAYAQRDPRVHLVARTTRGGRPAFGRNDGLAVARGEFITLLDADDVYLPGRIENAVDGLQRHPEWVAVFSDIVVVDEMRQWHEGTYLKTMRFHERARDFLRPAEGAWFECSARFHVFQALYFGAIHTMSVTIARERLPAGALQFDTSYPVIDDTDMWMRLARLGTLGYEDAIRGEYRQLASSISKDVIKGNRDKISLHRKTYHAIAGQLTVSERRVYRQKIAQYFMDLAYQHVARGEMAEARPAFVQAVKWRPGSAQLQALVKSLLPLTLRRRLLRAMGREGERIQ